MLFNSYEFVFLFLPLALAAFTLARRVGHVAALVVLLAASLTFYGRWDARYLLLLGASILGNYGFSLAIRRARAGRGLLLAAGIGANLALLGWFKYANFIGQNLFWYAGDLDFLARIVLPLGISFFTFQQIAFLVEVKRGNVRSRNFLTYALVIAFFPHLIAGPIVLYQNLAGQLETRRRLGSVDFIKFHSGLVLFAIGLFKKVVIADGLAGFARPVFDLAARPGAVLGTLDAWIGTLAYSLQLYFDFSGYSDMAMGLARMFGFRIPMNFNSPYKAASIIDFWRRWHMTLTNFFRLYVYIPLGGNRHGLLRQSIGILIVFLLVGLWHGAGWSFVLWGALHGVLLLGTHLWNRGMRLVLPQGPLAVAAPLGWAFTLGCVVLLWVLFRAKDLTAAGVMYEAMLISIRPSFWYRSFLFLDVNGYLWAAAALAGGWAIALLAPNSRAIAVLLCSGRVSGAVRRLAGARAPRPFGIKARIGVSSLLIGVTLYFAVATIGHVRSEFLYFQF